LNYIGFLGYSPYGIAVGINRPYQSLADLQKSVGLKFGGTGVQDNMALGAAFVINALGLKDARVVTGYGGSAEVAAAAAKGEIDGMANPAATIYRDIEKKFVKPPFLVVDRQRTEWFPNVPALTEVVKLSAEQEIMLNVFLGLKGGKVFFATPGISEERIEFIRSAFDRIVKMKKFLTLMEKAVAIWTAPTNGRDLFAEVAKLTKVSKEDVAKLRNLVEVYRR
jgi:tripartite-type tricarboxylate transporter receptor subunit TctC